MDKKTLIVMNQDDIDEFKQLPVFIIDGGIADAEYRFPFKHDHLFLPLLPS